MSRSILRVLHCIIIYGEFIFSLIVIFLILKQEEPRVSFIVEMVHACHLAQAGSILQDAGSVGGLVHVLGGRHEIDGTREQTILLEITRFTYCLRIVCTHIFKIIFHLL